MCSSDLCHIGCVFTDPTISHAQLAKGFGVYSEGPVSDPKDLPGAIKRAIAVVKRGEPALIDAVTQSR